MEKLFPISNEAEFQKWLAEVLKSERKRISMQLATNELPKPQNFEALRKDPAKETQHHEDER